MRAQVPSLLGRLESPGPGAKAAAGRRREAAQLKRGFRLEQQTQRINRIQGGNVFRSGFAKLD